MPIFNVVLKIETLAAEHVQHEIDGILHMARDGLLQVILSATNWPNAAANLGAAGWLFAIFSGCSTPILMSARQNRDKYMANRMV